MKRMKFIALFLVLAVLVPLTAFAAPSEVNEVGGYGSQAKALHGEKCSCGSIMFEFINDSPESELIKKEIINFFGGKTSNVCLIESEDDGKGTRDTHLKGSAIGETLAFSHHTWDLSHKIDVYNVYMVYGCKTHSNCYILEGPIGARHFACIGTCGN
jgi:hypothetical protein